MKVVTPTGIEPVTCGLGIRTGPKDGPGGRGQNQAEPAKTQVSAPQGCHNGERRLRPQFLLVRTRNREFLSVDIAGGAQ
jgi:hypothetical protein